MRFPLRSTWRAFGRAIARPYPTEGSTSPQRRGMLMLWIDNILTSISGGFHNDFEIMYFMALGATSTMVAMRSSINSAVSLLAPLLGAYLVAMSGRRKKWVLWSGGGIGRLCLVALALIPFMLTGMTAAWAWVGLFALQAMMGSLAMPAGNSLFGDVVPIGVRGRFVGAQMMAANLVRVGIIPLAGLIIARVGGLAGYQVTIGIAALIGFAATSFYARIPESPAPEGPAVGGQGPGLRAALANLLRDRPFRTFCAIYFLWNLGIQLAGPFFTVHMVTTLGFGVESVSLVATASTLVSVVAVRLAGPLVDRFGADRATMVGMLLVPLMPLAWILARTPFQVTLVQSYSVIAWASVQVAATPLILRLTPPRYRSQYIALYNVIIGIAAIIGPIPGGWMYNHWGFTSNLVASFLGRGLAAVIFCILLLRGHFRAAELHNAAEPVAVPVGR